MTSIVVDEQIEFTATLISDWGDDETGAIAEATERRGYLASGFPAHWTEETSHLNIAIFKKHEPFRARKVSWAATWALVCDDVHEKVSPPPLAPSWIVETKPGSEQWGYVLDPWVRDMARADRLVRSVIAAGLSDKGAGGLVRWFRLPRSLPAGKEHEAILRRLDPDVRFDPASVLARLGVEETKAMRQWAGKPKRGTEAPDLVLRWLAARGLILGPGHADDWVKVRCPWTHEHTNRDPVSYYKSVSKADGRRAWNCWHAHCAHRRTAHFTNWVNSQREVGRHV